MSQSQKQRTDLAVVFLPVLVLLSGFCGISYEILYTKLLGNLLGNQFTINATVLLTFLAGIGLGTLFAHRLVRWLWAIEAGIGIYAAFMALAYDSIDRLLYTNIPQLGTSVLTCAAVCALLLALPAFLVGCSVPLFAAYVSTVRSLHVFSLTYGVYNIGAAITALAMEFALLRTVGLRQATLLLALLNGVVALALVALGRKVPLIPAPRFDRIRLPLRDMAALAMASVASAIFQLMLIRIAECVLGPFNETFALVLATVLAALALGSWIVARWRMSFGTALVVAVAGVAWLLAIHGVTVRSYAGAHGLVAAAYPLLVTLKLTLVLVLGLIAAIGFGATVPALLRAHRDVARESGVALFVSSMGNVLGFVLMAFLLHQLLDYGPLLLLVAALTGMALWVHSGPRRFAVGGTAAVLIAAGAWSVAWDESRLYYGHEFFHSIELYEKIRSGRFVADRFKGREDVFAITYRDGEPSFFINGYNSIPLTAVAEKVAGAMSVMVAPRRDDALVLGIGSGATAGTVGLLFDHVEAVEINPVILQNLYRMAEYNFELEHQPTVEIIHDDGIHYIKASPREYSLIINTVTTPVYFSSSKLYTADFLRHVTDHLTPDGVYTTWVDQDLGDRGVDIILETLDRSFEQCWLTFLKSSYYMLACSNQELAAHQLEAVISEPRLATYLREHDQLVSRMLHYGVLSTNALGIERSADAPVNTLDFPVLEHEMAQLSSGTLSGFNKRLGESLRLAKLEQTLAATAPGWSAAEFAVWFDMRTGSQTTLRRMLNSVVPLEFPVSPEEYGQAALDAAREIDSESGWERYGMVMFDRGACDGAVESLFRRGQLERGSSAAALSRGVCQEENGRVDRAEADYRSALARDPSNVKAREALERLGVVP